MRGKIAILRLKYTEEDYMPIYEYVCDAPERHEVDLQVPIADRDAERRCLAVVAGRRLSRCGARLVRRVVPSTPPNFIIRKEIY